MLTVDVLEARLVRLSESPRLSAQVFAEVIYGDAQYPLWSFNWGDAALPVVIVVAGIHGDEPGGIEAALRLLETLAEGTTPLAHNRLLILPCANPSGFADRTRANRAGQDVNRQFHADMTQESEAIRHFLAAQSATALVELHTDPNTSGFYLFELRQDGQVSLGKAIPDTLTKLGYPVEERPFFGGYRGLHGLFAPTTGVLAEFQRRAPGLSLVEWALTQHIPHTFSFEAPSLETFERSVAS